METNPGMHYEFFTANDGTRIAYQTSVPANTTEEDIINKPPTDNTSSRDASMTVTTTTTIPSPEAYILLLHGFSGSSTYFKRNTATLCERYWVICPDMRGHGQSQHTKHGHHVSRLAMDLRELVTGVIMKSSDGSTSTARIYGVGCSIGAAVLWTYTELFTDADFAGLVFVDQAPLQDRNWVGGWGPGLAHSGCYDERTLLEAQRAWASEDAKVRDAAHVGLVEGCLGYRCQPLPDGGDGVTEVQREEDERFFVGISRLCDGLWLARLLADHTRYDHREGIELISKPVLVMAGKRSGCFSVEGMMETVRRAEVNEARVPGSANGVVFESGHWLFWEEPDAFHRQLLQFVDQCEGRVI